MRRIAWSTVWREFAAGMLLAASAVVSAQDAGAVAQTPATKTDDAGQNVSKPAGKDNKAPSKPDQKSDKEEPAEPKGPILDLGYSNWDLTGNSSKFRQYATPPQGLFISKIAYDPYSSSLRYAGFFDVETPFQDDYRLNGKVMLNWGETIIQASNSKNQFFTPTDFVIDPSVRQISTGLLRQRITPTIYFTLKAKEDQQDQVFEPPLDQLHQRTRTWDATVQGAVSKNGFAAVEFTDWRFFDRTQVEPNSHLTQWDISYLHQLQSNLNLEGIYTDSVIQQPSLADTHVQDWAVGGGWNIGDATLLTARWHGEALSLPNVQNAYVRQRQQANARLSTRWQGWTGEVGFAELDQERVRQDHLYVDTQTYRTIDGRVSGKVAPWLRFTGQAMRTALGGDATMETDDPLALYWRDVDNVQFKLDATSDFISGYAIYTLQDQSNNDRFTSVHSKTLTLGGDYEVRPDVDFYAEVTNDWWGATSGDPQAATLGLYFPNASVFVIGANWNINPAMTATFSYDQFWTDNENPLLLVDGNVKGQFFNMGLTYRFKNGNEVGAVFAPWHYQDKIDNLRNYDTALLMLTARIKF